MTFILFPPKPRKADNSFAKYKRFPFKGSARQAAGISSFFTLSISPRPGQAKPGPDLTLVAQFIRNNGRRTQKCQKPSLALYRCAPDSMRD
jgi:hypothetical protein